MTLIKDAKAGQAGPDLGSILRLNPLNNQRNSGMV